MSKAFAIGQRVRVRAVYPPGHVRTPHYLRGRRGVVDSIAGHFANPEELAYGRDGLPKRALYRVRFRQAELWPDYAGPGADSAVVDIYEHWLEPEGIMTPHHDHDHGHADGHRHPHQPDIEDRPFEYHQVMAEAVGLLLIEKGVLSADELRRAIEDLDGRTPALGARVVAHAWVDQGFRARLLEDVNAAAAELGIETGAIPIRAFENTERLHNVICCTLCSCYPRMLLGVPPDWYKSRAYRSRVVREPRAVLAEFGTHLPDDVEVRVHDSTADLRYMVLPARPAGAEALGEDQLAALVTRDCMIGTALPRPA